jgi:hypothetical protein
MRNLVAPGGVDTTRIVNARPRSNVSVSRHAVITASRLQNRFYFTERFEFSLRSIH